MENMNPSPSSSTHQPDSGTKETPFAQAIVHLTKQQYIQLKWNSRYWQRQHERAITREAALKLKLEQAEATIRDLRQRLYGKQSEKSSLPTEVQAGDPKPPRPRGQARGSKSHGRTPQPHLPVLVFCRLMSKSVPTATWTLICFQEPKTPTSSKSTLRLMSARLNASAIKRPANAQLCPA